MLKAMRKVLWAMVLFAAALTAAALVRPPAGPAATAARRGVVWTTRDGLLLRGDLVQRHGLLTVDVTVENHRARAVSLRRDRCGHATVARLYPGALTRVVLRSSCRPGGSTLRLEPGRGIKERWELPPGMLHGAAPKGASVQVGTAVRGRPALRAVGPALAAIDPAAG
jgi:hypothetical protein